MLRPVDERFTAVVEHLRGRTGVAGPDGSRRFGAAALQVDGAIFAMQKDGALVLKLPEQRVAELLAQGRGAPFGAGRGRPMREWVSVADGDTPAWVALAEEALAFVSGRRPG